MAGNLHHQKAWQCEADWISPASGGSFNTTLHRSYGIWKTITSLMVVIIEECFSQSLSFAKEGLDSYGKLAIIREVVFNATKSGFDCVWLQCPSGCVCGRGEGSLGGHQERWSYCRPIILPWCKWRCRHLFPNWFPVAKKTGSLLLLHNQNLCSRTQNFSCEASPVPHCVSLSIHEAICWNL